LAYTLARYYVHAPSEAERGGRGKGLVPVINDRTSGDNSRDANKISERSMKRFHPTGRMGRLNKRIRYARNIMH
jgi:hypothetical protein